jgi:aspartokinase-like uncharacterized kinase
MAEGLVVVKVGGSLFDLPGLGPRLRAWLAGAGGVDLLLVPGGGPTADVVRELDRRHGLGEEVSHWLALRALSVNALFLQALLPGSRLLHGLADQPPGQGGPAILDPYDFLRGDEGRPGCLPQAWAVTSDAVAARAAVVAGADRLVLLKSVALPEGLTWEEAAERGFVDPTLAAVLRQAPRLQVTAIDLRGGQKSEVRSQRSVKAGEMPPTSDF